MDSIGGMLDLGMGGGGEEYPAYRAWRQELVLDLLFGVQRRLGGLGGLPGTER